MKKCINRFYFTVICGFAISRVVVKIIGAVSWRDNNNLFIKFMVFRSSSCLKLHGHYRQHVFDVIYMYCTCILVQKVSQMELRWKLSLDDILSGCRQTYFSLRFCVQEHNQGWWCRFGGVNSMFQKSGFGIVIPKYTLELGIIWCVRHRTDSVCYQF